MQWAQRNVQIVIRGGGGGNFTSLRICIVPRSALFDSPTEAHDARALARPRGAVPGPRMDGTDSGRDFPASDAFSIVLMSLAR